MQELRRADNRLTAGVLALYLPVLLCVWLVTTAYAASPALGLLLLLPAWALIGWCQFALFNALHECLHNRFGDPHRGALGYLLAAYPVGFGDSYREVHLDHHRYFGDARRDPDYVNYAGFPGSRRAFRQRLLLNLCGIYAALQFLGLRQAKTEKRSASVAGLLIVVLVQLIILGLFAASVGWYWYLWLWLAPLATFGKFYGFLRTFCEHASPDDRPTIRTITGAPWDTWILGVFNFRYHGEHHKHVFVPCQLLPAAHALVADSLFGNNTDEPRYEHWPSGYSGLLRHWYRELPA